MPSWMLQGGYAPGHNPGIGTIEYAGLMGSIAIGPTETYFYTRIDDAYTWSMLSTRVIANAATAASTVRSRINLAFGNQTVTIGAGATGLFEDDANSDAVVLDQFLDWRLDTGAGGQVTFSILSCLLNAAANVHRLGTMNRVQADFTPGIIRYTGFVGEFRWDATEAYAQYRLRTAATLSNLWCRIWSNSFDGATTIKTRVNGAPGAQTLTIGIGATGIFEDTVNTDAIAVADLVALEVDSSASTVGALSCKDVQLKSTSLARHVGALSPFPASTYAAGTRYSTWEAGNQGWDTTELRAQGRARTAFTARNMFAYVMTNTLAGVTTIRMRKNGAPGNLNVSIGAGATGIFEDTANSDDFVAADLGNWEMVTAGAGAISLATAGFEQHQTSLAAGSIVPLAVGAGMV